MTLADESLLLRIASALSAEPFAPRVHIGPGLTVSRPTARAMERQLLRLRMDQRRAA